MEPSRPDRHAIFGATSSVSEVDSAISAMKIIRMEGGGNILRLMKSMAEAEPVNRELNESALVKFLH